MNFHQFIMITELRRPEITRRWKNLIFSFFGKTTPYGKILKILFQKNSLRHRSLCCVQIWLTEIGKIVHTVHLASSWIVSIVWFKIHTLTLSDNWIAFNYWPVCLLNNRIKIFNYQPCLWWMSTVHVWCYGSINLFLLCHSMTITAALCNKYIYWLNAIIAVKLWL